jgi:hypothetical protein
MSRFELRAVLSSQAKHIKANTPEDLSRPVCLQQCAPTLGAEGIEQTTKIGVASRVAHAGRTAMVSPFSDLQ